MRCASVCRNSRFPMRGAPLPRGAQASCACECAAQLQQESLQHATALQGVAQRADAAESQMHDLQRLMEAMQGAPSSIAVFNYPGPYPSA